MTFQPTYMKYYFALAHAISDEMYHDRDNCRRGGNSASSATAVLCAVIHFEQLKSGTCYASNDTIADLVDRCRRTVQYRLAWLVEHKYLTKSSGWSGRESGELNEAGELVYKSSTNIYRTTEKTRALVEPSHCVQKLRAPLCAKVAPEDSKESNNQQNNSGIDLSSVLLPETRESKYLFNVLAAEFEAIGQPAPARFNSLAQKRKFEEAETRLNGHTPAAIDAALANIETISLRGVINYVGKFAPVEERTPALAHAGPPPPPPAPPPPPPAAIEAHGGPATVLEPAGPDPLAGEEELPTGTDWAATWARCLVILRASITAAQFDFLLAHTEFKTIDDGLLTITAPPGPALDNLRARPVWARQAADALYTVTGERLAVQFEERGQ